MTTIAKSKICVISDLHLGVHTNSSYWHEVAIKWSLWLRDELREKGITDIMFCGDWHHNRSEISVSTLQVSADILEIFKEFNLIIILGNHDVYYKHRTDVNSLSIFKGRENVTVIDKPQTINAFGRSITMCPWETNVKQIPKSDVLFGHFEIETFKMNQYKVCEEGTKIKDVLAKSELVISGHFHTRHEKKYAKGTILYVGNPFQMDFGDVDNDKGYHILDLETLEYDFYKNTISPLYKKTKLSELVEKGDITAEVERLFNKNIVKLSLDKKISREDLTFLTNRLLLLKPEKLITEYDVSLSQCNNLDGDRDLSGIDVRTAIEEFISMLDIEDSDDILNTTLDLYKKCTV